jgi:hypothetical protein
LIQKNYTGDPYNLITSYTGYNNANSDQWIIRDLTHNRVTAPLVEGRRTDRIKYQRLQLDIFFRFSATLWNETNKLTNDEEFYVFIEWGIRRSIDTGYNADSKEKGVSGYNNNNSVPQFPRYASLGTTIIKRKRLRLRPHRQFHISYGHNYEATAWHYGDRRRTFRSNMAYDQDGNEYKFRCTWPRGLVSTFPDSTVTGHGTAPAILNAPFVRYRFMRVTSTS